MARATWALFAGAAILLAVINTEASALEQNYAWTAGPNVKNVNVSNIAGAITIRTGGDRVVVKAVKSLDGNDAAAKADFDRINVVFEEQGDAAVARVEYPNEHGKDWPDVDVRFDVTLPAGGKVAATSVSGDVNAAGDLAAFAAHTVSGDVTLNAGAPGAPAIDINTVSGDVAAAWTPVADGKYSLTSVSGELAAALAGDLPAVSVDATTISGRYKNELGSAGDTARGSTAVALTTVSGDITVGPPAKAAVK
jgi:hypothetical protein